MVLGLLSRSLSFSRSLWLFGDSASSSFFSLLKRSRPVRRICSSIFRWRFMSDSTLSSRASLFTEERAEDPGRDGRKNIHQTVLKPLNSLWPSFLLSVKFAKKGKKEKIEKRIGKKKQNWVTCIFIKWLEKINYTSCLGKGQYSWSTITWLW